jgi:hypothetical protein
MTARWLACLFSAALLGGCAKTELFTSPDAASTTPLDPKSFSNQILPGGSASREMTLTASGQIAVTLTRTTPDGTALGLGIGIPRSNSQCALSSAVTTTAGSTPQVSMPADGGTYCVKVFDTGTLTAPVTFTVSISHP